MTSILRQRMLDAMVLSGKAARTQEAYIGAVFGLARHYHRSPDVLTADEVQHYLLHLLRERHLSRSSVNQYGRVARAGRPDLPDPTARGLASCPLVWSAVAATAMNRLMCDAASCNSLAIAVIAMPHSRSAVRP